MKRSGFIFVFSLMVISCSVSVSHASGTAVVLVTGFEPFLNFTVNPSGLIAEELNGSLIGNTTVVGIVLPVDFNNSFDLMTQAIGEYHPVLIIGTGLDAKTHRINVEKFAYNLKRYQREDGTWSFPRRIDPRGPFLRVSPLHTHEIVRNIRKATIPVQQSFFTGTYVCNSLFYQTVGFVIDHQLGIPVGFIHVPLLDSQDPQGMSLPHMVKAVEIAIQASLETVSS
jgi:pyroglutamyl-peptidase